MRQIALVVALAAALAAAPAPAPAQTRVSVAVGFGVPRPYVSGFVVVGRPYFYRPYFYRPPVVVVVRRRYDRVRRHHHLYRWSTAGYTGRIAIPPNIALRVWTPRATMLALRAGYIPQVHQSVQLVPVAN